VTDAVLKVLSENGYAFVPAPLKVAGVAFGFDAALVGPGDYGNLVVVVEDDGSDSVSVVKRVKSLMLVLNRSNSARPVTIVLVASAQIASLEKLSEFAHVVVIPPDVEEPGITRALKSLLRLRPPEPISPTPTETVFSEEMGALKSDPAARALVSAARRGSSEVEAALVRLVTDVLEAQATEDGSD
jgi:hypothetical protein